jgi:hypothetical protein
MLWRVIYYQGDESILGEVVMSQGEVTRFAKVADHASLGESVPQVREPLSRAERGVLGLMCYSGCVDDEARRR